MDLSSSIKMAWQSLLSNKMRSFLTMLGVIIGVGAVIAMVAISQGAAAGITERIASMGSNLLMVSPGGTSGPIRGANTARLTNGDMEAIRALPLVKYVAGEAGINSTTIALGSNTWTTRVVGTNPELMAIKNWPTSEGAFFENSDLENLSRVAVLGNTVVENLFPAGVSPLGQVIRIEGLSFTVIGVLETKGSSGASDPDDVIYIPLTTAQQRLVGSNTVQTINVQAESQAALEPLKEYITTLLRQRHRLAPGAEDDFRIRDMAELLETLEDTSKMMTFLMGGIAGVSLLVGGIGIMNIMLVSVTERTREIGIRMAIGATTGAILLQFIIEALVLCFVGGVIGVAVGCGTAQLLSKFAGFTTRIEPWLILLAVGFSLVIGLFFGYYPAKKAADLDPIEALRFE